MPDPNPNRDLPPEEVESLVAAQLPHLLSGLGRDRTWVWFSGAKPSDEDRKLLLSLGFSFTPRPHTLEDGRTAHWFHACGGAILRRRKGAKKADTPTNRVSTRQHSTGRNRASESSDAMAELRRLADLLPS